MSKYIDADKLIERLEEMKRAEYENCGGVNSKTGVLYEVQELIESLRQEQPEPVKGKFVFPKLLYARTLDNKTIDVSYAPQDMTAIEYVRNDAIEQEQPEVDLEKEIDRVFFQQDCGSDRLHHKEIAEIARHFYNLALENVKENIKKREIVQWSSNEYNDGFHAALLLFKNIIDNLTK